jgi:hypothetical protein
MYDPFIKLMERPNSTTITPNRDIDYVLTHGIDAVNLSTMAPNFCTYQDQNWHMVILNAFHQAEECKG